MLNGPLARTLEVLFTLRGFMSSDSTLKHCIDIMIRDVHRERIKVMEKLIKEHGDKFYKDGITEYIAKRDALDEMFQERYEKLINQKIQENS